MPSANLPTILLTLPFLYLAHRLFGLAQNYLAARRTGLPVLVNPVSIASPIWIFGKPLLVRLFASWDWIHRIENFNQKEKFESCGTRAFWLVNHRTKELHVADPAVAEDVLKRCRVEFPKNPSTYTLLEIFGPNVVTSNGAAWARHRKVTAPPFNERISERVWEASGRQAEGAREKWLPGGAVVRSTEEDTTRIAFNVLSAAGFGLAYDFADVAGLSETDRAAGRRMSYRDALDLLIKDVPALVVYVLARRLKWPVWAMWGGVAAIATARDDYEKYMQEMLRKEREEIRAGGSAGGSGSLMGALVRESDQGMQEDEAVLTKAGSRNGPLMTDDEILGNLFVYNLAGHDTTAGALNFAVTLVACEPKWQEWLAEEIDAVISEDQTGLKYSAVFPKLHRCLALMYETLRMYGPVPMTPRYTANSWQTLTIDGKEYAMPPGTEIALSLAALHHDPNVWSDPLEFRPDRWIPSTTDPKTRDQETRAESENGSYDYQSESLIAPKPGTFLPWTAGSRVCPGKKFSQVEFTRVILGLFRDGARVRIVHEEGESQEQARARVLAIANDLQILFTLRMKDSEKIGLKWYTKGGDLGGS